MELYLKYRPKRLKDVLGQSDTVETLLSMVKDKRLPRAILFTGPSGCGKTTLGRILVDKLGCNTESDFNDINCALVDKPLQAVKDIKDSMWSSPLGGKARVWLLDEVQSLSRAKFAQQGLLKILEDMPGHAYFILCTTDPAKIIKAVHTRCTTFKINPLPDDEVEQLVQDVWKKEGNKKELSKEVIEKIVQSADGSARQALVILEQVLGKKSLKDMLEVIHRSDYTKIGFELVQAIMRKNSSWKDVQQLLQEEIEEAETIRRIMLGYCLAIVTKAGGPVVKKAAYAISCFRDPIFDTGKTGKAILASCCYEAMMS